MVKIRLRRMGSRNHPFFRVVVSDARKTPTSAALDEIEARLDPTRFLRIHRSYLVNAAVVRELVPWFSGTYQLKLDDGRELPVARRRIGRVKQALGSA